MMKTDDQNTHDEQLPPLPTTADGSKHNTKVKWSKSSRSKGTFGEDITNSAPDNKAADDKDVKVSSFTLMKVEPGSQNF